MFVRCSLLLLGYSVLRLVQAQTFACGADADPSTCPEGFCCGISGYCGDTPSHCGGGCQPDYGTCWQNFTQLQVISQDGLCGATANETCTGSVFGDCCSVNGYCGNTQDYCGEGCQSDYGSCGISMPSPEPSSSNDPVSFTPSANTPDASTTATATVSDYDPQTTRLVSQDGLCGPTNGDTTCLDSEFGDCCSSYGFCGSDAQLYCGEGCDPEYGICGSPEFTYSSSSKIPPQNEPSASSYSDASVMTASSIEQPMEPSLVPSSTSSAVPSDSTSGLPTLPEGLSYYMANVTIDGDEVDIVFLVNEDINDSPSRRKVRRQQSLTFEDCIQQCAVDSTCTEVVFDNRGTNPQCIFYYDAICANPAVPDGLRVAYKVGSGTQVNIPTCLSGGCGPDYSDSICDEYSSGPCCDENGSCGDNSTYCAAGCQQDYGSCWSIYSSLSFSMGSSSTLGCNPGVQTVIYQIN